MFTLFYLNIILYCEQFPSQLANLFTDLLWKAPELLRDPNNSPCGSQKADVYAFAIILYEIIGRRGPFGSTRYEPRGMLF